MISLSFAPLLLNSSNAISKSVELEESATSQQRSICIVEDSSGRETGEELAGKSTNGKYSASEIVMVLEGVEGRSGKLYIGIGLYSLYCVFP